MNRKLIWRCLIIILGISGIIFWSDVSQNEISKIPRNLIANKIVIKKSQRELFLYSHDRVIRIYKVALGWHPGGRKIQAGDGKTPEGVYNIDFKNSHSHYHLSLRISYPNRIDKRRAKRLEVSPGGEIMIHGMRNGFAWIGKSHRLIDWTNGCIAVTNDEIEEIWKLVPKGTLVIIKA